MTQDISKLSIRAATWLAVQCLKKYCATANLVDYRLSQFCEHLESLTTAIDIPAWDALGNSLAITGMGDPLPEEYQSNKQLEEIISCAREISAAQIYGAWNPQYTAEFLARAMHLAGAGITNQAYQLLSSHKPLAHGFGNPVEEKLLKLWKENF